MPHISKLVLSLSLLLFGTLGAAQTVSTTVTFDEVPTQVPARQGSETFLGPLLNGYAGFRWGAFAPNGTPSTSMFLTENNANGNNYVATAGQSVGFITRADGADFYFDSLDVWSRRGVDAIGDFSFVLYHDGQTVYNGRLENQNAGRNRFTGVSQSFAALVWGKEGNTIYSGPVDGMAFAFDNDDYDHFAFDNLKVRVSPLAVPYTGPAVPAPTIAAAVPEPETYAMFLAGLCLMGTIARRKKLRLS